MKQADSRIVYIHARELDKLSRLGSTDVLWISDVYDHSHLIEKLSYTGRPGIVISDHYEFLSQCDYRFYSVPLLLEWESTIYDPQIDTVSTPVTGNCFSFMINKKRINRYLLIKLIQWFGLSRFDYTWSGIGQEFDLSSLLEQGIPLPPETKNFLLAPIQDLPPKFFIDGYEKITDSAIDILDQPLPPLWRQKFKRLYGSAAVSLITETIGFEQGMVFTEKTIWPMLAGTFPIWVGGYKQAQRWKQLGFDVFDDVINHDYQHRDTLAERCYYAIKDNLPLLEDLTLARRMREIHWNRLVENQYRVFSGKITVETQKRLGQIPENFRPIVQTQYDLLRNRFNITV